MAEQPRGFEYKHVECPQIPALVNVVTNDHGKFYWELTGTQTIVAKESHLESGEFNPDNLYSVTTSERFVAMDFRRATDAPNLSKIKEIEREYFQLCAALVNLGASPLDGYSAPPSRPSIGLLGELTLKIWPWPIGNLYYHQKGKKRDEKHYEAVASWQSLKARLDGLLQENKPVLNID